MKSDESAFMREARSRARAEGKSIEEVNAEMLAEAGARSKLFGHAFTPERNAAMIEEARQRGEARLQKRREAERLRREYPDVGPGARKLFDEVAARRRLRE